MTNVPIVALIRRSNHGYLARRHRRCTGRIASAAKEIKCLIRDGTARPGAPDRPPPLVHTREPNTLDQLLGMMNLRGVVVPVIDPCTRFGPEKRVSDAYIVVVGEDLGDRFPRKVVYFPATGRLRVKKLASTQDRSLIARESSYMNELETAPVAGETELF